jgi:ATP-dependent DNA helicase PIF1
MHAPGPLEDGPQSSEIVREREKYDPAAQALKRDTNVPMMNDQQRDIYTAVMAAVNGDRALGTLFFVDGLGGAGKTFLYGCLLNTIRADSRIALSVASSGIAALLLEGGRTAHSRFRLPIKGLCETSTCDIKATGELADLIKTADLIVWDETPMTHKHHFEA